MRKRLAMCALYAGIALGIGVWAACDNGTSVSTAPAAERREEPVRVPLPDRSIPQPSAEPREGEVLHHDSHRVWLETATPESARDLCEGALIPALVMRRDDPQGNIYAMVYASDPEHDAVAHGETRHAGLHLSNGEDMDLDAGELSVLLSYVGTVPDCLQCGEVRSLVVGIRSVRDRDDGADHAATYEIGPELTFSVRKRTDPVCLAPTAQQQSAS